MKKTIVPLFCALFGLSLATTSCQDMLTPDMDRYAENFSGKDTVNFYFGILNNVQGMIEQNVLLGELRGDLVKPTEFASDSINDIIMVRTLCSIAQLTTRSSTSVTSIWPKPTPWR